MPTQTDLKAWSSLIIRKLITGPIPIATVFVLLTLISWQRWPDLMVDYGQQLYLPWVVSEGQVLYHDAQYFHGPLSTYVHALIFSIFGVGILQLALFNLVLIALVTFLIYRLCDYLGDAYTATVVSLTFISVFAFAYHMGFGSFNFVTPYLYDLTHGILLSVLILFLFYRYLKAPRLRTLCGLGFLLGLLFLTKVEVCLATLLSMGGGLLIFWRRQRLPFKKLILNATVFASCAGLVLLITLLYFSLHMPVSESIRYVFNQYLQAGDPAIRELPYYQFTLGLMHFQDNLQRMGMHAATFAGVVGLVLFLNHLLSRGGHNTRRVSFVAGAFTVILLILMFRTLPWLELTRSFPLFLFLFGFYLAWQLQRESIPSQTTKRRVILWALVVFALTLTFKAFFNFRITDLGFALAMPATLVMVFFLLHSLPRLAERISGKAVFVRTVTFVSVLFFLAVPLPNTYFAYQNKTYPIGTGTDRIYDFQPMVRYPDGRMFSRGLIANQTLDFLKKDMMEGQTLLTLPDAMIFNYFLRKRFPTRNTLFSPFTMRIHAESEILSRLQSSPPSHILLVHSDYSWFGQRYFGTDFAREIYKWILADYKAVAQFGVEPFTSRQFGVQVWKRRTNRDK
ncbi:PMT_2 domain-containing protein [Nitrospina watsonii]|uniref:PMT_2 domain-containing protein n=2 Tax=Nitrospina watsonii TaxID=1323948 RepID=A0ABM9HGQ1_9BACT|nr:PMT_2 domain-containing protein [Nitrospina watsonii]